jgi:excisionase family DNA binding protein
VAMLHGLGILRFLMAHRQSALQWATGRDMARVSSRASRRGVNPQRVKSSNPARTSQLPKLHLKGNMNTHHLLERNDIPTAHNGQSDSTLQRLLTPGEVASWLGVSNRWVRDHATRRMPRIPAVQLGSLLRFRPADIEAFIAVQLLDATAKRQRRR